MCLKKVVMEDHALVSTNVGQLLQANEVTAENHILS